MITFFLFKQKTAYELRISDWSSDVCSSDLGTGIRKERKHGTSGQTSDAHGAKRRRRLNGVGGLNQKTAVAQTWWGLVAIHQPLPCQDLVRRWRHHAGLEVNRRQCQRRDMRDRSEERRVGKECVSTCRSRWSPYS